MALTGDKDKKRKPYPPTYFVIALLLAVVLHLGAPVARVIAMPWSLVGLLPVAIGIWLNPDADRSIKARGTTVKPFERPTSLISNGAFALSRNPMYLRMVLIFLGLATVLGTVSPFVAPLALWVWLDRNFVEIEEQIMHQTFGEQWQRYASRVRRWI